MRNPPNRWPQRGSRAPESGADFQPRRGETRIFKQKCQNHEGPKHFLGRQFSLHAAWAAASGLDRLKMAASRRPHANFKKTCTEAYAPCIFLSSVAPKPIGGSDIASTISGQNNNLAISPRHTPQPVGQALLPEAKNQRHRSETSFF